MNQNKIILGFVGEISSGKGTACKYLNEKYGAGTYRFSTIIRDILDRLFLPQSRENMQNMSTLLRQNFSEDILAKVMAKQVSENKADIICVDGIRRLADIVHLKQLPGFHLIHLSADERKRYDRIVGRAENTDDTSKTFEQFQLDQQQEADAEISEVAKGATIKVVNDGNFDELYAELDKLIQGLKN
jgi:dephospho-CoA kinase